MVGGLVIAGLLTGGWFLYGRKEPEQAHAAKTERKEVAVSVAPVTLRSVMRKVSVVGSLYGKDEVTVTPKVEGRVVKIYKDVGDFVRPGDLLIEIDPTDYRLAVNEAQRALELELAKLGLKELPEGKIDVTALPTVSRASVMENNAASRRDRLSRLGNKGAATAEDSEQAQTDYAVARANRLQAILDAEATLAAARQRQAVLATAQQRLKDTRVIAPSPSDFRAVEGTDTATPNAKSSVEYVIYQRSVAEGEIVQTMVIPGVNSMLFKLAIDNPLKMQATIPERHRGDVKIGMEAELEVESYPGIKFPGKVARVNPAVDRANRTFQVEIHVPNDDRRLSPGSFARATIRTRVDDKARTVPEEALVAFAGVTKVFTVKDGKAHAVPVHPGPTLNLGNSDSIKTWVEIDGDLSEGSLVVVAGQTRLAEDTPVRVRDAAKEGIAK